MKKTNYLEDLEEWEEDLHCNECGDGSKEAFYYCRTVANGDVYFCKNCKTETLVDEKPKEDDY